MHMFYTHITLAMALTLNAAPVAPSTQVPPAFAGVWEIIEIAPKPAAGSVGALPPSDLTVTQSPTAVSLATTTPWGDVNTTVYSLDGREDRNRSGAVTRLTRSTWQGAVLVTEGRMSQVTSQGYEAWTLKETMRLDGRGQLIIERNSMSESGSPFHSVVTYRRKKGAR
jgi:hypothetical protein